MPPAASRQMPPGALGRPRETGVVIAGPIAGRSSPCTSAAAGPAPWPAGPQRWTRLPSHAEPLADRGRELGSAASLGILGRAAALLSRPGRPLRSWHSTRARSSRLSRCVILEVPPVGLRLDTAIMAEVASTGELSHILPGPVREHLPSRVAQQSTRSYLLESPTVVYIVRALIPPSTLTTHPLSD